jgi:hypothetical protein
LVHAADAARGQQDVYHLASVLFAGWMTLCVQGIHNY